MTTTPEHDHRPAAGEPVAPYNAWQEAYTGEPGTAETSIIESPPQRRPTAALRMAALVAAAVAAGAGVTYVLSHDSSANNAQVASSSGVAGSQQNGTGPQQDGTGAQQGGGFGQGGPGGVDGEQRIIGTVSKVGASSITLATPNGAATFAVSGATEISKDGAQASLSDLTRGELVQVHLIPSASGSTNLSDMTVERIIVGTGGFRDGGGGPGGPDDQNGTGTTTGNGLDT